MSRNPFNPVNTLGKFVEKWKLNKGIDRFLLAVVIVTVVLGMVRIFESNQINVNIPSPRRLYAIEGRTELIDNWTLTMVIGWSTQDVLAVANPIVFNVTTVSIDLPSVSRIALLLAYDEPLPEQSPNAVQRFVDWAFNSRPSGFLEVDLAKASRRQISFSPTQEGPLYTFWLISFNNGTAAVTKFGNKLFTVEPFSARMQAEFLRKQEAQINSQNKNAILMEGLTWVLLSLTIVQVRRIFKE